MARTIIVLIGVRRARAWEAVERLLACRVKLWQSYSQVSYAGLSYYQAEL